MPTEFNEKPKIYHWYLEWLQGLIRVALRAALRRWAAGIIQARPNIKVIV